MEQFAKIDNTLPNCGFISGGKRLLKHLSDPNSDGARRMLTLIVEGLRLPAKGNVLEIGPGDGRYGAELAIRGHKYTGFDLVPQNKAVFKTNMKYYGLENVDFQIQDICEIKEHKAVFDGIFANATFEHIWDRDKALKNCFKLLKPGGRLVILDGNAIDPRMIWKMAIIRPIKTGFRSGGLKWILGREKVYDNFGVGWKGKDEAYHSVFWWKRKIDHSGFTVIKATCSSDIHPKIKRVPFLVPFIGQVYIVAEKPKD